MIINNDNNITIGPHRLYLINPSLIIMTKALYNKRGAMATGSMMIVIASILTTGAAGTVILGTVNDAGDQASAVAEDTVRNLCDGLVVVDATGHYSINNLTELQLMMKLSPGSNPIDLTKIVIFVTTQYGETPYFFENSTHLFTTVTYTGTDDTIVQKGELLMLTIPDLNIPAGDEAIVKLIPEMGQILSMSFTVPDSLGNEFAVLQ
jgi:archaellin